MNLFFLSIFGLSIFGSTSADTPTAGDQQNTERHILEWADALFINHSNYKFETLRVFETEEHSMQAMRIELYEGKINSLKQAKDDGTYAGSAEAYEADVKKLSDKLTQTHELLTKIQRVDHYETHFWTNIQTTDGITVYYELIIKQDHLFHVIEAIENSSIGKKGSGSKIAYKGTGVTPKVIEK